ncbi:MAG: ribonucleoside-triphosphate reductase, partial [Bacteroidaceae bacterium]|nr:ribonucleoside-triphosphate reductase [Bacteroidaceae bacterium]
MSTENFIITKRDGTQESFSLEKIKSAILKAFANVSEHISAEQLKKIVDHLMFCNGMSVEDIQNQVEVALMAERHFKAAKAFMLYRQRHMEDRETADKLRFLMDYCDSANAATGSKFDANANVENKNIATLISELP